MGMHEWLLKRGYKYEMNDELRQWLEVYEKESESSANEHCDRLYLSRPISYRAIAPNGTTGILASTTTGIEPLYAVAYKRRYIGEGDVWKYQYVIDGTAEYLIKEHGLEPDSIETAVDLASDPERRIKFQADVQEYVDMGISSTLNLPAWGSEGNNPDTVPAFASLLARYSHRLRGFTCYPDGSRDGQPLTSVPYSEAVGKTGVVFNEHDICEISGKGGSCGA
jgi:ribonucleoside-diphosphate reductase alpha chain